MQNPTAAMHDLDNRLFTRRTPQASEAMQVRRDTFLSVLGTLNSNPNDTEKERLWCRRLRCVALPGPRRQ